MYSMIVLLRIGGRSIDLLIRQSTKEVLISSTEILSASQSVEEVSIFLDKDPLASPSLLVSLARRLEEKVYQHHQLGVHRLRAYRLKHDQ
jgi:hypothetical protein